MDTPWTTEALVLLGRIQQSRSKWTASVEFFNKALRRDPKHIDAYLGRYVSYSALDKEELALHDKKMMLLLRREKLWTREAVVLDGAKPIKR